MSQIDLKDIWKSDNNQKQENLKYSAEEIQHYRTRQIRQNRKSVRWTMLFDITFKLVLALGFTFLFFLTSGDSSAQIASGILASSCIFFAILERRIFRNFEANNLSESIISRFSQEVQYLKTTYQFFLMLAAFTNPLFITAGFFYYSLHKYGSVQMTNPYVDFVPYIFITIGYIFSLAVNLPLNKSRIKQLTESIEILDDELLAKQKIDEQKKRKSTLIKLAVLGGILGLILFIAFVLLFYFHA